MVYKNYFLKSKNITVYCYIFYQQRQNIHFISDILNKLFYTVKISIFVILCRLIIYIFLWRQLLENHWVQNKSSQKDINIIVLHIILYTVQYIVVYITFYE